MRIAQVINEYQIDPSVFYGLKRRGLISAVGKWTPAGEDYEISSKDKCVLDLAKFHPQNTRYLPIKVPFYRFIALMAPFLSWAEFSEVVYTRHLLMRTAPPLDKVVKKSYSELRKVAAPHIKKFKPTVEGNKVTLPGWWKTYASVLQIENLLGSDVTEAFGFMYNGFEIKALMDIITLTSGSAAEMRDALVSITGTPAPVHYVFVYAFLYNDWGLLSNDAVRLYSLTLPESFHEYYNRAPKLTPMQMLAYLGLSSDKEMSTETLLATITHELMRTMSQMGPAAERRRRELLDNYLKIKATTHTAKDTETALKGSITAHQSAEQDMPIVDSVDAINNGNLANPYIRKVLENGE